MKAQKKAAVEAHNARYEARKLEVIEEAKRPVRRKKRRNLPLFAALVGMAVSYQSTID